MKKYLIVLVLLTALVAIPVCATNDNQSLIQSLIHQIQGLVQRVQQLFVRQQIIQPQSIQDSTTSWQTYTNTQYGLSIKYPEGYEPADTTYGWPQAIVLFGGPGGQSYYLAIEVWDDQSEFNKTRGYNVQPQPTFKKVGNRYISLWNVNNDPTVEQMVSTFASSTQSSNNQITINSVLGPTSLTVGQTGTWTIKATGPEGSDFTYRVAWGEEDGYAGISSAPMPEGLINQTGTFTHSYAQAGTYTVRFKVQGIAPINPSIPCNPDSLTACSFKLLPAESSITVKVSDTKPQG